MSLPATIAAPFLDEPGFRAVMAAIARDGDAAWAVGGAVRNALLGQPVADVDVATTALPATVMARAAAVGLKAVPTGIDHGTVTVVAHHVGYEVTTLRADVATDGRRAVVAFTRDLAVDAGRRDFTMNAVYADPDGRLTDPTGGVADALARRVRFIGDAEARIREDYLRILRFFRFHATYGRNGPDPEGLAACGALGAGLDRLSRERIGQEMAKLVKAARAGGALALMDGLGLLGPVFGGQAHPDRFERLCRILAALPPPLPLAYAVLAGENPADAARLGERLRLSNRDRGEIERILTLSARLGPAPDEAAVRLAVYRDGNAAAAGGLVHATLAAGRDAPDPALLAIAERWAAPAFPLTGRDLVARGHAPGPGLGRRLAAVEAAWIAGGFGDLPDLADDP